jgi:uncharacterized protein YyaL (SSP411 family)
MERESFDNDEIAALQNELFVSIKVDREERPDIDDVYMRAVQLLIGRGGWPLTAFLTPDRKPFHGGTYFPPVDRHGLPGFPRVLRAVRRRSTSDLSTLRARPPTCWTGSRNRKLRHPRPLRSTRPYPRGPPTPCSATSTP